MKSIFFITSLFLFGSNVQAEVCTASWYGPGFQNKRTASGQIFDTKKLTAAHKSIKFGTKVKVTNLTNNKVVFVTINDKGPFIAKRCIDLSYAAKNAIGMGGTARVSIEKVN